MEVKFSRPYDEQSYNGSPERFQKTTDTARKIVESILKNGLSYDEAGEAINVAQKFISQCKVTSP